MKRRLIIAFAVVMSVLAVTAMPVSASHADPTVVSNHATDSDFNAGTLSGGMNVEGSGESAVVTVDGGKFTETFTYTGSEQTWTVPVSVNSVDVELDGAGSGSGDAGGRVTGTLSVTPGETLRIYVGEQGGQPSGGWNGGGDGGSVSDDVSADGYGGGGATDIRQGGSALGDRVAVAGGAGGNAVANDDGISSLGTGGGGQGGADTGQDGGDATANDNADAGGGGGGTQNSGGAGGHGDDSGTSGSLGQGGTGGDGFVSSTNDDCAAAAGGGGGGYYGGGGGGWDWDRYDGGDDSGCAAGGGGGGSNYDDGLSSVDANERGTGSTTSGQVDITYSIAEESATYISQNHTVSNSVGGEVNITEIENGSVTVSWEGWDGSSWTTLNQTTSITTTGIKEFTWSTFTDSDTVRVNVTAINESGSGGVQFTMADEGVKADTVSATVNNSSATPTGQLNDATPTLSIDVNDTDFATAHGDTVTVEFFVDGSSVGTDTLTSNGTATFTTSALTGGDHTWHVEATDEYGLTDTSSTFNIATPDELFIRDETNASRLVDDATVNITAYYSGQIIRRSSSDGTVDLTGFPVDEPIVVRVQAEGYYTRTVVIEDIFDQQSAYLLNSSVAAHQVRFDLQDPTGRYDRQDTVLFIERDINLSGTIEWRAIAGDDFGIQGVPVNLVEDERYRLRIKNLETGVTATLGSYTAIQNETVTLSPGEARLEFDDIERHYTWEARQNDTSQQIIVEYAEENSSDTADVKITIHERFNTSDVLVDNQTFTDVNSLVFTEPLSNTEVNQTWALVLYVDRGEGYMRFGPQPIGSGIENLVPGDLDAVWRTAVGVFVLLIASMAFSQLNRGVGAVTTSILGGFLWYIGLLELVATGPAVVFAIAIGVVYSYRTGGGF